MVPSALHWRFCAAALFVGFVLPASSHAENQPAAGAKGTSTPATVSTQAAAAAASDPAVEFIRERFADGRIKLEREVVRDREDNYVNHGLWKMWDEKGIVVAEGQYRDGERHGVWTGCYLPAEVPLLNEMPYREYQGPFVSQAEFSRGKLHGCWTIYDARQHKISEWHYLDGRRHGSWTSWYANGRKMQESHYLNNDLDGTVCDWTAAGQLTTKETYQAGCKLGHKIEYYTDSQQKKSDEVYLFAKQELQAADDWWNATLAQSATVGKAQRHGESKTWHSNGQLHTQGTYAKDQPVGIHHWYYANGQKAVEGTYSDGQRHGRWSWFHANGQKSIQGELVKDVPQGKWVWWNIAGKVAQRVDYSDPGKSKSDSLLVNQGAGETEPPAEQSILKASTPANDIRNKLRTAAGQKTPGDGVQR
ncbi:MAG: hypothetical protein K8T91_10900 [Planctomycetes bacterium]|nr:hypothetical protein [Planctomycetota bacterium]